MSGSKRQRNGHSRWDEFSMNAKIKRKRRNQQEADAKALKHNPLSREGLLGAIGINAMGHTLVAAGIKDETS